MCLSAFLEGFELHKQDVRGIKINYAVAGSGPPVLLLHGHPQTHVAWRKIAPRLAAEGFQVVVPDLRGYGDSDKPKSDNQHLPYSKREMAADQVALMAMLGHERFAVVGHDRGGRVAHRMALDYPEAVCSMTVLDIAPTLTMYQQTDQEFATRYFWWFFLIQPYDFPERLIGNDPEYFLRRHIAGQVKIDGSIKEDVIAEYLRTYRDPATIHAICEDYRAAASIDLVHDRQDLDHMIQCPVLVIWGQKGVVGQTYNVIETWRHKTKSVEGLALNCGHAIPEEMPTELVEALLPHLQSGFRQ